MLLLLIELYSPLSFADKCQECGDFYETIFLVKYLFIFAFPRQDFSVSP